MDMAYVSGAIARLDHLVGALSSEVHALRLMGDGGANLPLETASPLLLYLTIFILATFLGFSVVWRVTPALHSPLMAITNAVSSVIIVGALWGMGALSTGSRVGALISFLAITLCAANIVGGFLITHRMLGLFSQGRPKSSSKGAAK